MTDEQIKSEILEIQHQGGELPAVELAIHRERPPGKYFFGPVFFLSEDSTIAFLASRLPMFSLVYDVYIAEE